MSLWINDSGASTAEIKTGIAAATRAFENAGWAPGIIARAMDDDSDPAAQDRARDILSDAETDAFRAAFAGWAQWPEGAILVWDEPRDA